MLYERSPAERRGADRMSWDADVLHAALEEAYQHKSALWGLYETLRAAGAQQAGFRACEASEAAYQLVVQLTRDLESFPRPAQQGPLTVGYPTTGTSEESRPDERDRDADLHNADHQRP